MRLRPELCPGPAAGAYSAPPGPLAGFGEGEQGRGMETAREGKGMEGEGKERKGKGGKRRRERGMDI